VQPKVLGLLKHMSFDDLERIHNVNSRVSANMRKVSLNYDSIRAKIGDDVASECRGIVIASPVKLTADWKSKPLPDATVLAWPMTRFFNNGQVETNVDWSSPRLSVQEKLDGTMIACYYDHTSDRWCTATRSVPDADVPIAGVDSTMTFHDLFNVAIADTVGVKPQLINGWFLEHVIGFRRGMTYVFELTSPINRVVVAYDKNRVTLLAARDNVSGKEVDPTTISMWNIPRPNTWNLSTPTAINAFISSMSPTELEGVVVCDHNFNREKIKHKDWHNISRAKSALLSRGALLESIIVGDIDDMMPYVSDTTKVAVAQLTSQYVKLVDHIENVYMRASTSSTRKEFAMIVKDEHGITPCVCFNVYDRRVKSVKDWFTHAVEAGYLNKRTLEATLESIDRLT